MANFVKLTDFKGWVKAKELNNIIFLILDGSQFAKYNNLKMQMKKTSRSVMANLAEGHGRKSNKEFIHFISIALGSLQELRSDVYICHENKLIPFEEFKNLIELIEEISKISHGLINYLVEFELNKEKSSNQN